MVGDRFGRSVAVSGDVVLISATRDTENGLAPGSAYVFRYAAGVWTEEAKLIPSDGDDGDRYGWSVSVSGDVAVVGSPGGDGRFSESGSAYVFRYTGGTWTEEAKLFASDGEPGDSFGGEVIAKGDLVFIGASRGSGSGSAYVFRYVGGIWTEEAKLIPSDGEIDDVFGVSLAVSGGTVIVGASLDDDNGSASGSAYIFDISSWM